MGLGGELAEQGLLSAGLSVANHALAPIGLVGGAVGLAANTAASGGLADEWEVASRLARLDLHVYETWWMAHFWLHDADGMPPDYHNDLPIYVEGP